MSDFTQLLGTVLVLLLTAAGLAVHGNLTIALRRRPQPRKETGQ